MPTALNILYIDLLCWVLCNDQSMFKWSTYEPLRPLTHTIVTGNEIVSHERVYYFCIYWNFSRNSPKHLIRSWQRIKVTTISNITVISDIKRREILTSPSAFLQEQYICHWLQKRSDQWLTSLHISYSQINSTVVR